MWNAIVTTIKRLTGMPDYEAYVAHLSARHPERPVPSEREFYDEFVRAKQGSGVMRCC